MVLCTVIDGIVKQIKHVINPVKNYYVVVRKIISQQQGLHLPNHLVPDLSQKSPDK